LIRQAARLLNGAAIKFETPQGFDTRHAPGTDSNFFFTARRVG